MKKRHAIPQTKFPWPFLSRKAICWIATDLIRIIDNISYSLMHERGIETKPLMTSKWLIKHGGKGAHKLCYWRTVLLDSWHKFCAFLCRNLKRLLVVQVNQRQACRIFTGLNYPEVRGFISTVPRITSMPNQFRTDECWQITSFEYFRISTFRFFIMRDRLRIVNYESSRNRPWP